MVMSAKNLVQINYSSVYMEVRRDRYSSDPTFDAFEQSRRQRAEISSEGTVLVSIISDIYIRWKQSRNS